MEGYDIHGRIIIHHMLQENQFLSYGAEYLISTTLSTHNAIPLWRKFIGKGTHRTK